MKKIAALSLFVILISSCSSLKQFHYMSKTKAPKGSFRIEVPFELKNELIVMKVKLNGSEKEYEFLLDSGAPTSVIFNQAREESKAESVMEYKVLDSQGHSVKSEYVLFDMSISDHEFKDVFAAYTPEPGLLLPCIAHDGIIGANMMQTANWHIDFEHKKIIITDLKKSSQPDLSDYLKVSFKKRSPFGSSNLFSVVPGMVVKVTIKDQVFKHVLIDLGSSGGLNLPVSAKTDSLFKDQSKNVLFGFSSFGLFGANMDTTFYYHSSDISIGGKKEVRFHPNEITLENQSNYLIGTEILSDYDLYIDFRKKNMYLKTVREASETGEKVMGFYLFYDETNSKCYVSSIYQGSSAEQSGLILDDVILEVDGATIPKFADFCEFREWSRALSKKEQVTLKIEREEKVISMKAGVLPRY